MGAGAGVAEAAREARAAGAAGSAGSFAGPSFFSGLEYVAPALIKAAQNASSIFERSRNHEPPKRKFSAY